MRRLCGWRFRCLLEFGEPLVGVLAGQEEAAPTADANCPLGVLPSCPPWHNPKSRCARVDSAHRVGTRTLLSHAGLAGSALICLWTFLSRHCCTVNDPLLAAFTSAQPLAPGARLTAAPRPARSVGRSSAPCYTWVSCARPACCLESSSSAACAVWLVPAAAKARRRTACGLNRTCRGLPLAHPHLRLCSSTPTCHGS